MRLHCTDCFQLQFEHAILNLLHLLITTTEFQCLTEGWSDLALVMFNYGTNMTEIQLLQQINDKFIGIDDGKVDKCDERQVT